MSDLTAATVSRNLGKRFKRSERATTRVKGYHRVTEGFKVTQSRVDPEVYVEHVIGSTTALDESRGRAEMRLTAYADHLRAAGFAVKVEGSGYLARLVVTR